MAEQEVEALRKARENFVRKRRAIAEQMESMQSRGVLRGSGY